MATSVDTLLDVPLIITEKMDGSNTSLEAEGCFARTHSGVPTHASFDGLKALHASLKCHINHGLQLFGEWCYAKHSIEYSELPGYFLLFNMRDLEYNEWAAWKDVEIWAGVLDIPTVPVLFQGQVSSEKELKELTESFMNQPSVCGGIREGVVIRLAQSFLDDNFSTSVMKCVRANHIQTTEHWKNQEIVRNKLKVVK
jgi:hypothetical protein